MIGYGFRAAGGRRQEKKDTGCKVKLMRVNLQLTRDAIDPYRT